MRIHINLQYIYIYYIPDVLVNNDEETGEEDSFKELFKEPSFKISKGEDKLGAKPTLLAFIISFVLILGLTALSKVLARNPTLNPGLAPNPVPNPGLALALSLALGIIEPKKGVPGIPIIVKTEPYFFSNLRINSSSCPLYFSY
jgi:hypothetical protein